MFSNSTDAKEKSISSSQLLGISTEFVTGAALGSGSEVAEDVVLATTVGAGSWDGLEEWGFAVSGSDNLGFSWDKFNIFLNVVD